MDHVKAGVCSQSEDDMDLRRGPWTVEEDFTLINYIAHHGEGRWNSLARSAGLKRTGKSCRLRWLNYLRPDVRRGNITLEEQLLILELHSRWGNRWSKIAQHLPGRTDNEIKNYWRTRVQKHAKQLKCDVNSKQFKDTMRYLWMPRLMERIQAAAAAAGGGASSCSTGGYNLQNGNMDQFLVTESNMNSNYRNIQINPSSYNNNTDNNSSTAASSESVGAQVSPVSELTECYNNYSDVNNQDYCSYQLNNINHNDHHHHQLGYGGESLTTGYFSQGIDVDEFQAMEEQNNNHQWLDDNLWNVEDMWFLHHQLNSNV